MSTKIEFKWKPGELESVSVRKVENGLMARVAVRGNCHDYAFAEFADALELLAECFCWDVAPIVEVAAEPVPPASPAYPSIFRRFEVDGAEVRAIFRELFDEQSYTPLQLAARIDTLKLSNPAGDELAKWEAVLAELNARRAAARPAESVRYADA